MTTYDPDALYPLDALDGLDRHSVTMRYFSSPAPRDPRVLTASYRMPMSIARFGSLCVAEELEDELHRAARKQGRRIEGEVTLLEHKDERNLEMVYEAQALALLDAQGKPYTNVSPSRWVQVLREEMRLWRTGSLSSNEFLLYDSNPAFIVSPQAFDDLAKELDSGPDRYYSARTLDMRAKLYGAEARVSDDLSSDEYLFSAGGVTRRGILAPDHLKDAESEVYTQLRKDGLNPEDALYAATHV